MRRRVKWSLILAAAAVSALLETTTVFCAEGWQEEDGKWRFYDDNGEPETDTWKKTGTGNYIYLDENGWMLTNAFIDAGDKKYYLGADGARVKRTWVTVPNRDGQWEEDVTAIWYYFGSDGNAVTGKDKIEGKTYIFDEEGRMLSGWQYDSGGGDEALYYLGGENEGYMYVGWQYLKPPDDTESPAGELNFYDTEEWFYFSLSNGKAYRDVLKNIDGKNYSFDANGVMVDGWQTDSETCDGSVQYYNQGTGDRPQGWAYVPGPEEPDGERYFYYFDKKGVPFNAEGADGGGVGVKRTDIEQQDEPQSGMALMKTDDRIYLFNDEGQMQTGLYELTDVPLGSKLCTGLYYFEDENEFTVGERQEGERTITQDGIKYSFYFRNDGRGYVNAIRDDILYGPDGYQIPLDSERMIYTLTEDTTWDNDRKTLPAGTEVCIDYNRKLVKSKDKIQIDETKWKIKNYVATQMP